MTLQSSAARIAPILVHIQTHLEDDLSLERLAEMAGLSPYHFHRVFRQTIGETVKQYTLRLRLERAAYQLKLRNCAVIDVAFLLGFQSHETFTRAFKKRFGLTPKQFKQQLKQPRFSLHPNQIPSMCQFVTDSSISPVRIVNLNPIEVAYIRHYGRYEEVDVTLFGRLVEWALANDEHHQNNALLGIGHDDPQITSPEKTRFDACIQIADSTPLIRDRLNQNGDVSFQMIPGGTYATATISGPTHATTYGAYGAIFQHVQALPNYQFVGIPSVEMYRATQVNTDFSLEYTEVYLPIEYLGPT